VELPLDPRIDTHRADRLHVARARPEGETVEDVVHLLVGGLFASAKAARTGRHGGRTTTGGTASRRAGTGAEDGGKGGPQQQALREMMSGTNGSGIPGWHAMAPLQSFPSTPGRAAR
jgi:hypothetical protein